MIGRLRRKIEPRPKVPRLILTVPGFGYKFAAPVQRVDIVATLTAEVSHSPPEIVLRAPERRVAMFPIDLLLPRLFCSLARGERRKSRAHNLWPFRARPMSRSVLDRALAKPTDR
jgi:hypothetical protein